MAFSAEVVASVTGALKLAVVACAVAVAFTAGWFLPHPQVDHSKDGLELTREENDPLIGGEWVAHCEVWESHRGVMVGSIPPGPGQRMMIECETRAVVPNVGMKG